MQSLKKVWIHNIVIAALHAHEAKYLKYALKKFLLETYVCVVTKVRD